MIVGTVDLMSSRTVRSIRDVRVVRQVLSLFTIIANAEQSQCGAMRITMKPKPGTTKLILAVGVLRTCLKMRPLGSVVFVLTELTLTEEEKLGSPPASPVLLVK